MVKFNRRRQKAPEAPIFSDTHSTSGAEGESTGDNGSSRGFTARIIVTEGSNPCNVYEPSQEAALDTTLGLEDSSYCSFDGERGNDLVIITSTVLESEDSAIFEPDSEEDEEAAIEIDEEFPSPVPKKRGDTTCNRIMAFKAIIVSFILVLAIVIPASIFLSKDDAKKAFAQEKSVNVGDDLDLADTAAPSSNGGNSVETMIPENFIDANVTVFSFAPQEVQTSSPTSSPTFAPSPAPTADPTPEPTPDPTPEPTPRPSPSPTIKVTQSPTFPPSVLETEKPTSLAPTSLAPTPGPTSPQFSVAIFQTSIVTPAPTSAPTTDDGADLTSPPTPPDFVMDDLWT